MVIYETGGVAHSIKQVPNYIETSLKVQSLLV